MIPRWTPVAVTWLDANTDYEPAQSSDFAERWKKCVRRTIGWLIHSDRERVVIAMDDDREDGSGNDCQTVTTIPRAMIQGEIVVFRPAPRKKTKR